MSPHRCRVPLPPRVTPSPFLNSITLRAERLLGRPAVEFLSFSLVGLSGVAVNLGLYAVLTRTLSISLHVASPLAIETSIIWNFTWNDTWTFGRRLAQASLPRRLARFHAVCALGGVLNYLILVLSVGVFGWWDIYGNLLGILAGAVAKYAVNSAWTWREHSP
jgi:dolichol-phosphate mannosyltransferase